MTLMEVLVATMIISVAAIGVLSYSYHGAMQRRMAAAHIAATQVAHLLLEDWKANGGSVFYARGIHGIPSPLALDMGFEHLKTTYVAGGTIKCAYEFTVDTIPMQITLSRPVAHMRLVPLKVTTRWRLNLSDDEIEANDPRVVLIANARIDQAGG